MSHTQVTKTLSYHTVTNDLFGIVIIITVINYYSLCRWEIVWWFQRLWHCWTL